MNLRKHAALVLACAAAIALGLLAPISMLSQASAKPYTVCYPDGFCTVCDPNDQNGCQIYH